MGGFGSGRWNFHISKYTVDESLTLKFKTVHQTKKPADGRSFTQVVGWDRGGVTVGRIMTLFNAEEMTLTLDYSAKGQPIKQTIKYTSQARNFGGHQYFWRCGGCGARCLTLHAPANSPYFRCRGCHDLTYLSSQMSHAWDRGQLAAIAGTLDLHRRADKLRGKLEQMHIDNKRRPKLERELRIIYARMEMHHEKLMLI